MKTLSMLLLVFLIAGCSSRATYENLQINKRNECARMPPAAYEECMEGADKSYDEYERERQEYLREREDGN